MGESSYLARFYLNRFWLLIPLGLLPYLRPHLPAYALRCVLYHLLESEDFGVGMVGVDGCKAPCECGEQTPILSAHLYYPHPVNPILPEVEILKGRAQVLQFGLVG